MVVNLGQQYKCRGGLLLKSSETEESETTEAFFGATGRDTVIQPCEGGIGAIAFACRDGILV